MADECLGHRDAANQIIRKSRDGRSITAVYAASNRCARDLACTFVIEIGTLPDADADAGSFARFRAQKTRSEPHALKAGSSAEFRFQEMIDTVPAGESVDFRVTAECR